MKKSYQTTLVIMTVSFFLISGCGKTTEPVDIIPPSTLKSPTPAFTAITKSPSASPVPPDTEITETAIEHQPNLNLQLIHPENANLIVPVAILDDHNIVGSSISPDGKQYTTNTYFGIHLYDTYSGEEKAFYPTNGAVLKATFSHDASKLAAVSIRPGSPDVVVIRTDKSGTTNTPDQYRVMVWDITSDRLLFSQNIEDVCGEGIPITLLQFLEDDSLVLTSINFDSHIQSICRISSLNGEKIDQLNLNPDYGYVRNLAISSDGNTIAAAFSSGSRDYLNPVLAAFHFPDGESLFERALPVIPTLAYVEQTNQFLYNSKDIDGRDTIETITPGGKSTNSFIIESESAPLDKFTANNHYLIVTDSPINDIIVYDYTNGNEVLRIPWESQAETIFPVEQNTGYSVPLLAQNSDIFLIQQFCIRMSCSSIVRVFDLENPNTEVNRSESPLGFAMQSGDLSPDGKKVTAGGLWNGDVRVWSTQNGKQIMQLSGHQSIVYQTLFSPNGMMLATTSADGTVRLWNTENGELLHTLTGHKGWVLRAVFSPDGSRLISSGEDNTLRLWETTTGQELKIFPNPDPAYILDGMWFISENILLISLSDLRSACIGCHSISFLLDTESGETTPLSWEHLQAVNTTGGDWLIRYESGEYQGMNIINVENDQMVILKSIDFSTLNNSSEIAISPDNKLIYSLNLNGINVFDRSTGEQIALAANHCGILTSGNGKLEASPDGRFLIDFTGSDIILLGIPE